MTCGSQTPEATIIRSAIKNITEMAHKKSAENTGTFHGTKLANTICRPPSITSWKMQTIRNCITSAIRREPHRFLSWHPSDPNTMRKFCLWLHWLRQSIWNMSKTSCYSWTFDIWAQLKWVRMQLNYFAKHQSCVFYFWFCIQAVFDSIAYYKFDKETNDLLAETQNTVLCNFEVVRHSQLCNHNFSPLFNITEHVSRVWTWGQIRNYLFFFHLILFYFRRWFQ